jgi:hypothetical protein
MVQLPLVPASKPLNAGTRTSRSLFRTAISNLDALDLVEIDLVVPA